MKTKQEIQIELLEIEISIDRTEADILKFKTDIRSCRDTLTGLNERKNALIWSLSDKK